MKSQSKIENRRSLGPGPRGSWLVAFTLIELLVVITIIVVLLALLVPAMEKAIYRAELTVCASQLRGIGSSVTMYAHEYKRFYPYRGLEGTLNPANGRPPNYDQAAEIKYHPAVTDRPFDQRQTLRIAMPNLNKQLSDPLTGYLDLEADAEVIFAPYNLWWGFTYYNQTNPRVMHKIGENWSYNNAGAIEMHNVLAGDRDLVRPGTDSQSSHPDDVHGDGTMVRRVWQNQQGPWLIAAGRMTMACWFSSGSDVFLELTSGRRSPVDNNYVMNDGSVTLINRVQWDKFKERGRVRTVSTYSNGWQGGEFDWMFVP